MDRDRIDAAARDPRRLASYYAQGVEAWYAGLAVRRGSAVVLPGNHDHNFRLLKFLDSFEAPAGSFVHLDVGCGAGLYAVSIALRHASAKVVALDIAAANLHQAAGLAARERVADRISYVQADAMALPLSVRPDTILCSEIIEHLPDPLPLLRALRDLCGLSTRLYVSVPHINPRNLTDVMYVRHDESGIRIAEGGDPSKLSGTGPVVGYYHHLYEPAELRLLLEKAGFQVERQDGANWKFPRRWPGLSFAVKKTFGWAGLDRALVHATGLRYAGNLLVRAAPVTRGE